MVRFLMPLVLAGASVTLHADALAVNRRNVSVTSINVMPISIGVFAAADVPESLVKRIFVEAEAIWGPAGIELDWHPITSTAERAT